MDEEKKDQEQEKAEPEAKEEEKTEEKKEPDGAPVDEKKEEPAVKTFTQEEVNRIVRERVARASKDTQVMAAENTALKNSIACYKAGVKAECVEDAVTLAARLTDDKTDFSGALAKVLEKYPAFAAAAVKNSSVDMQKKAPASNDDALREAMGLKRKEV